MPISVVISDDHPIVCSGVCSLLNGSDVHIVGEAATPKETIEAVQKLHPDVLIIDVRLADGDAFEVLEALRERGLKVKVVVLSAFDNPTYIARALIYGVSDYLLKDCTRESLLASIRDAAKGESRMSSARLRHAKEELLNESGPPGSGPALTRREWQIARHLALGLSNREIGLSLNISIDTVKEHVQKILNKLELRDRTEAGVWAARLGLGNLTLDSGWTGIGASEAKEDRHS